MNISILAIGSEILDGRVLDTNSQYIAQKLSLLEIALHQTVVCDDVEKEIIDALNYLTKTAQVIIVTGGLGPTTDDLTREAVAAFCGTPLKKDAGSLERLKKRFEDRKRRFDPSNEKQAFFPENSSIIPNAVGTAEGFFLEWKGVLLFSVPGVPKEMHRMFDEHIFPLIEKRLSLTDLVSRQSFKVFGLPEATVGRKIQELSLPHSVVVSYRAAFPEIHVVLKSKHHELLAESMERAIGAVGSDFIYARNDAASLPEYVGALLLERNATISVAESCTGGMLGVQLTKAPGASGYFAGGALTYSNELKQKLLGVSGTTLAQHGAVSSETACEMAAGCRKSCATTFALSITGIAGPEGGTEEKPAGTFFVGIASDTTVEAFRYFFPSDRASVRIYAVFTALDLLRRTLLGLPAQH